MCMQITAALSMQGNRNILEIPSKDKYILCFIECIFFKFMFKNILQHCVVHAFRVRAT